MKANNNKSTNTKLIPPRKGTKMGAYERKYNIKLGVRPDMTLATYLTRKGFPSLAAMLEE